MGLEASQVHELFKLFGEAHEIVDRMEVQRHLLSGFLGLIGGACILRIQCHDYVAGGGRDIRDGIDVGVDDCHRKVAAEYYQRAAFDPAVVELVARHQEVEVDELAVLLRSDVVSDTQWYSSPYVSEVRRPSRIDDGPLPRTRDRRHDWRRARHSSRLGGPPFLQRGLRAGPDIPPRVLSRFAPPRGGLFRVRLSRRERQTLKALLAGARRKEIAAELGLSLHTVNDYVKSLYRRLGVSGLPELYQLMSSDPGTEMARRGVE